MSKKLFRFELSESLKKVAAGDDDIYEAWSVPERDELLSIRWNCGQEIYDKEVVMQKIREGVWIKTDDSK